MNHSLQEYIAFKPSDRKWHFALLVGICTGIPLMVGYFAGNFQGGKLASLAGLVILYLHSASITARMVTLMACSFGIMLSFVIGSLLSFTGLWSALLLGMYACAVHRCLYFLKLMHPPGNFFFIMIASVAICMPYDLHTIPERMGYVSMGTMISCTLGLLYSWLTHNKYAATTTVYERKEEHENLVESITFGCFVGLALLVAKLLHIQNPYWAPTSCVAVMQGTSTQHIWQRTIQRISGTFLGLGVAWLILLTKPPLIVLFISITVFQVIAEWLVVRNYGIAVILITVFTIFLAEQGSSLIANPNQLMTTRFFDILVGSIIGAIGGWVLYNERIRFIATRQVRKARMDALRKHT